MLTHWGQDIFCYWAIILSLRAIILFVADGYVRYIVNQYNMLFHTEAPKATHLLSAGISFLTLLSLTICIALGIILFAFPICTSSLFAVASTTISLSTLSFCLLVFIVGACMQMLQRMYAACHEARGRVAQNMVFEVLLIACEIAAILFLSLGDFGFKQVVALDSAVVFGMTLGFMVYLRYRYPLPGMFARSSVQQGFGLFRKATQLYAYNFFEKLSTDGLVVLLSFFRFDKAAIALFSTIRTIVNTPILAQNLLLNTYTPKLQAAFALRDAHAVAQLLRFIRLSVGAVLLLGILLCLPFYENIFIFWTKGRIAFDTSFLLLLLMMTVGQLLGTTYLFMLKGLNALSHTLGLMLAKTMLIFIGLLWSQQQLLRFAVVLIFVEWLSAIIVLPRLAHQYVQQNNFVVSKHSIDLGRLPFVICFLLLLLYSIAYYYFDFKIHF